MLPITHRVLDRTSDEIVTLQQLKDHLDLFGEDSFDAYLTRLLVVGQQLAENHTGEYFSNTTVQAFWNRNEQRFTLPQTRVASITSMQVADNTNMSVAIPATGYFIDRSDDQPAVVLNADTVLPALSNQVQNPISITYVANASNGNIVDEEIRQAVLLYCAEMFNQREGFSSSGAVPQRLPITSERLLSQWRRTVV